MKVSNFYILVAAAAAAVMGVVASCSRAEATEALPTLKEAYADNFLIGCAVNDRLISGGDSLGAALVKAQFNTIVAENVMKSEKINPAQGVYDWEPADAFVDWGERNGMFIVGHCLVWHSQLAPWFAYDAQGRYVSADTLKARMATYIADVVGRYKGRVQGWDVVNEAIEGDGSYRRSPFYEILGEEYIPYAFELAHQADPDAELYINDYGMDSEAKADRYVAIVNDLKERGLRIDAIGMQGHMGMDYPDFARFEQSLEKFGATGCQVMVTEWDMSALPTIHQSANISETVDFEAQLNPYPEALPTEVAAEWNQRMGQVWDIIVAHSDVVSRVNAWGVTDGDSWKNDWPMAGRREYPLLFDRQYQMKDFLVERLKNQIKN
ncbi:MAG: endo-1,4-beta-xylanase [Bacteroidales bacterium]|nr:endo-1,4-beta-xylanase [Bacteroidales bacterium]